MMEKAELEKLQQANFLFFEKLFGGRTPGAIFICLLFQILHVYDDLIDNDVDLSPDEIHKAFWIALVELPNDPFFLQYRATLGPVLINSIINWKVANQMESLTGVPRHLGIAWILRGSYLDMFSIALACERGVDYAVSAGQLLRDWAHAEDFELYLTNLMKEKAARHAKSKRAEPLPDDDRSATN